MIRWEQSDIDRVTGKTKLSAITEAEFQREVMKIAAQLGWTFYHTHDSIGSQAGFPDLVLVRREHLIFAELKTEKGKLSKEQQRWKELIDATGAFHFVWRPSMREVIVEILR